MQQVSENGLLLCIKQKQRFIWELRLSLYFAKADFLLCIPYALVLRYNVMENLTLWGIRNEQYVLSRYGRNGGSPSFYCTRIRNKGYSHGMHAGWANLRI